MTTRDISVVRAAIDKIVKLLTNNTSITVTQQGAKAFVAYDPRTGAVKQVNIPKLPDNASDLIIAAAQGFLDHEVGHVLFTDQKTVVKAAKENKRVKNIHNLLEDVYVENKMIERFRGSVGNLEAVRKFHIEKIALPEITKAVSVGDIEKASSYAAALKFRAWGGQTAAIDFFAKHPEIDALTKPLEERFGAELIAKVSKLKSSEDAFAFAKKMDGKSAPAPKEEPPSSKGPSAGKPTPKGTPPEEDTVPADEEDCEPPIDEGTTHAETDDSGKERDEKSKSEEAGKDGGEDGDGATSKEGSDEDAEKDEGEATGESETPGSEPDPSMEASEPELHGDDDDEPPAEGEEGGDTDDGIGSEDDPFDDMDDTGEASGEDGTGASDDSGEKSETTGKHIDDSSEEADDDRDDGDDDLGRAFEEARDFDDEAARALTTIAVKEMKESEYRVFSTEWDKIVPAPLARNDSSITKMVDKTQHMIAGIQKQLERAMAAKDRKTWNPGLRRGRVAPGALFKTAVGDDRVFRQRYETRAKNTAVSLLVDCSGSMSWSGRIAIAGTAAYALSSTLERLRIRHEVIGFTTKKSNAMTSAMNAEGLGISYNRSQALYMPVFKSFDGRLDVEARSRIAHLTEHPDWLNENVDGECVQIAGHRLRTQRAERHILIVLSDGMPACPGGGGALNPHLKKTVKDLEGKGVEVVGIGIETDAVKSFYSRHIVLRDLEELPTTVVGQLTKLLLAP